LFSFPPFLGLKRPPSHASAALRQVSPSPVAPRPSMVRSRFYGWRWRCHPQGASGHPSFQAARFRHPLVLATPECVCWGLSPPRQRDLGRPADLPAVLLARPAIRTLSVEELCPTQEDIRRPPFRRGSSISGPVLFCSAHGRT